MIGEAFRRAWLGATRGVQGINVAEHGSALPARSVHRCRRAWHAVAPTHRMAAGSADALVAPIHDRRAQRRLSRNTLMIRHCATPGIPQSMAYGSVDPLVAPIHDRRAQRRLSRNALMIRHCATPGIPPSMARRYPRVQGINAAEHGSALPALSEH